jgi:endoglucanase
MMGGAVATTHFIIDTSRNGQGTLNTAQYAAAPYYQPATVIGALASGNWCNPPGAGVGLRPSANTGVALLDAYLWVKVPGESDGQCDSAGGARAWNYSLYNPWNQQAPPRVPSTRCGAWSIQRRERGFPRKHCS